MRIISTVGTSLIILIEFLRMPVLVGGEILHPTGK